MVRRGTGHPAPVSDRHHDQSEKAFEDQPESDDIEKIFVSIRLDFLEHDQFRSMGALKFGRKNRDSIRSWNPENVAFSVVIGTPGQHK
jgi:hypothetical protein